MLNNYIIIFKYLSNINYIQYSKKNKKTIYIVLNNSKLYIINIHLALSQFFYTTQLIDIFSYNTIVKSLNSKTTNNVINAHYFNLLDGIHIYLFLLINNTTKSIEDFFLNSVWLEREYSEMNGIIIYNKSDTRNLLLQYNNTTTPLIKSFSSIGLFEIYYNLTNDSLIKIKVFNQ